MEEKPPNTPFLCAVIIFEAYGSYENIIELKNNETLSIFTGCPYEQIIMEGKKSHKKKIDFFWGGGGIKL